MDYSLIEKASAIPEAASMIETFRAIGYNLEAAIADIIDNSISANAKNIYVDSNWQGDKTTITILDDGDGMNNKQLIQAMRPGAQNPLASRNINDLGRFGLGLKTASFSQCRKLTVLSKCIDYSPVYWTWDLDYVNETSKWELLRYIPEEYKNALDDKQSGTLVIWNDLDRILPIGTEQTNEFALGKFTDIMEKVKCHIQMTFHRFIEEKKTKFHFWNREIKPWNPFLINEPATQAFSDDYISGGAMMKGYVLPHKSRLNDEAFKNAEGINGWGAQQGFYVYRGKRLLLAGDWLGMFRKEEHYKLVRILIDLPNTLDSDWQIDIKKSTARPPLACREQIASYARDVRANGVQVYRHRGKILKQKSGQDFEPLWLDKKKGNKWSFIVNREHLMIKELKELAHSQPDKAIEQILRFIEETIPSKSIFIKESEEGDNQKKPFEQENTEIVKSMIKKIFDNQILNGKSSEQAKATLLNLDPFDQFPELIETIDNDD